MDRIVKGGRVHDNKNPVEGKIYGSGFVTNYIYNYKTFGTFKSVAFNLWLLVTQKTKLFIIMRPKLYLSIDFGVTKK